MGSIRSHEMLEIRTSLMRAFTDNEKLQELLLLDAEKKEIRKDQWYDHLLYEHIYPHEYVPDTNMVANKFLNFELQSAKDLRNPTYKNLSIYVFAICHETFVDMYDSEYGQCCWYDLVACEVDQMLTDKLHSWGVGECELVSNEPYYVSYAANIPYKGRTLIFQVKDFTDGKKNGR